MKIISIFNSIDGEVNYYSQGRFSTFIRLAGCNLHCDYCDTKWSWDENNGAEMTVTQVKNLVDKIGCKKVTITGGEPLLQENELEYLIYELCKDEYSITVETNGTYPINLYPSGVHWVVDYKSSSVGHSFYRGCNFKKLTHKDWVKFVIGSRVEYEEVLPVLKESRDWRASIAVGPMHNQLEPAKLVEWMQEDKLFHCVINLQLHKYIWPNINQKEER
jgi:7-carboxy-7-deazaguanine synthase